MATELTAKGKVDLIFQNLQEVLKPEIIEDVIIKQNRPLNIYWGKRQILPGSTPAHHAT